MTATRTVLLEHQFSLDLYACSETSYEPVLTFPRRDEPPEVTESLERALTRGVHGTPPPIDEPRADPYCPNQP